jgi:hypothetical protein
MPCVQHRGPEQVRRQQKNDDANTGEIEAENHEAVDPRPNAVMSELAARWYVQMLDAGIGEVPQ